MNHHSGNSPSHLFSSPEVLKLPLSPTVTGRPDSGFLNVEECLLHLCRYPVVSIYGAINQAHPKQIPSQLGQLPLLALTLTRKTCIELYKFQSNYKTYKAT